MGPDLTGYIPIGSNAGGLRAQSAATPATPPPTQPAQSTAPAQPEGYLARVRDYAENALTKLISYAIAGTSKLHSDKPGHAVIGTKPQTKLAGYCSLNVVSALNAAGVHVKSANAKDLPGPLKDAGFNAISSRDYCQPLAGDVMIIDGIGKIPPKGQKPKPGEHPYGHVAVYTGDPPKGCGWVSDGIQLDDKFCLNHVSKSVQESKTTYYRNPTLAALAVKFGYTLGAEAPTATATINAAPTQAPAATNLPTPAAPARTLALTP